MAFHKSCRAFYSGLRLIQHVGCHWGYGCSDWGHAMPILLMLSGCSQNTTRRVNYQTFSECVASLFREPSAKVASVFQVAHSLSLSVRLVSTHACLAGPVSPRQQLADVTLPILACTTSSRRSLAKDSQNHAKRRILHTFSYGLLKLLLCSTVTVLHQAAGLVG